MKKKSEIRISYLDSESQISQNIRLGLNGYLNLLKLQDEKCLTFDKAIRIELGEDLENKVINFDDFEYLARVKISRVPEIFNSRNDYNVLIESIFKEILNLLKNKFNFDTSSLEKAIENVRIKEFIEFKQIGEFKEIEDFKLMLGANFNIHKTNFFVIIFNSDKKKVFEYNLYSLMSSQTIINEYFPEFSNHKKNQVDILLRRLARRYSIVSYNHTFEVQVDDKFPSDLVELKLKALNPDTLQKDRIEILKECLQHGI
ncbi:hypothetical protein [Mangrovivirga cuniculi]|uniref:Uncharacterized protein n=1 Tax=Mangrovivirga cuniculi TaxID=2715131 RepID=A0A4D7JDZ9_9BACT|nr:hypothetical protein [Mangrovivirga cuniculi]QCK14489.1 hypothetical protein DCC35_06910 [Mangrovivirga cuniculi]